MPRIKLAGGPLDPARLEELRRDQQRSDYRKRAEANARAARLARLTNLQRRSDAIAAAMEATMALPRPVPEVRVRNAGIYTTAERRVPLWMHPDGEPLPRGWTRARSLQEDRRTRPPLARLIYRSSPALNTWMAMLHVLVVEDGAGANTHPTTAWGTGKVEPWARLTGRWGGQAHARQARMGRDLRHLRDAQLVRLRPRGAHETIERFTFLTEDRHQERWTSPEADYVTLPGAFFRNGWHLVLSPQEIVAFLMIRHAHTHSLLIPWHQEWGLGVRLTVRFRWERYGVTSETYESLHDLEEFGLVAKHDSMPERRLGRFNRRELEQAAEVDDDGVSTFAPEPYEWQDLGDKPFERNAFDVVQQTLVDHPTPQRMLDEPLELFSQP